MAQKTPGQPGSFRRWLARKLALALAFILVFVAGAAVMHVGMHAGDHERIMGLQAQATQLQADLSQSQAALLALRSQTGVQAGTQRVLQDTVTTLQQELGKTRDQLAFYEQLIPPGPAGAVAVRAFDIQQEGEFFHYRVLLTRNTAPGAAPFKGRMRFVANGLRQGKIVKISLAPPLAPDAAVDTGPADDAVDPLALVFEQFQRSTGVLQMVPDLTVQSIRLEILENDTVRATQDATLTARPQPVQEPHHDRP